MDEPVVASANKKTMCTYWSITHFDLDVMPNIDWTSVPHFKYLVYQEEECPETGTKHHQCFLAFTRTKRFTTLRNLITGRCDISKMHPNSTPGCLRDYCMKEESRVDGPWEIGQWTVKDQEMTKGKRTDLLEVQEKIKNGASMKRIADEHFGSWCKYNLAFKKYKSMQQSIEVKYKPTDFNYDGTIDFSKTVVFIGPSGIGKTQFAKSHFKNPLLISDMDELRNDTEEHDGIIFDDISLSHWPTTSVIHLLDMEETRGIHCRYETVQIPRGTKRIFTHNNDIEQWLIPPSTTPEQKQAIFRRINVYKLDKLF